MLAFVGWARGVCMWRFVGCGGVCCESTSSLPPPHTHASQHTHTHTHPPSQQHVSIPQPQNQKQNQKTQKRNTNLILLLVESSVLRVLEIAPSKRSSVSFCSCVRASISSCSESASVCPTSAVTETFSRRSSADSKSCSTTAARQRWEKSGRRGRGKIGDVQTR